MADPLLSVVIPVYNRPNLIIPCTESILQAGLDHVEIIIVDDCSSDNTLEVCHRLAEEKRGVRVLHLEVNHGQGFARNEGLLLAGGNTFSS